MSRLIYTKQIVPNPEYNPEDKNSRPNTWHYELSNRPLRVGDMVEFLCNGRGRGGHYRVSAKVTKVNAKTFKATEWNRSYAPGTNWTVYLDGDTESRIYIDLSWKE